MSSSSTGVTSLTGPSSMVASTVNNATNNTKGSNGTSILNSHNEDATVRTLCEWAVSAQRSGEHRALVVARLIEKRQNDISTAENEDKDGNCNPFQNLLLKFLDTQAPVYG